MSGKRQKQLEVGIDWLTAIFRQSSFNQLAKYILHMDRKLFAKKPAKKMHTTYAVVYEFGEIKIFAEPAPTENNPDSLGCTLELSGTGCNQFSQVLESQGRTWQQFFRACYELGNLHITRIDLAIDDRNERPYFTLKQLVTKAERKEYLSEKRKHKVVKEEFENGHALTLYIGKRGSELVYRFYDKQKEQATKTGRSQEEIGNWIRTEMEIRKELANRVVEMMSWENMDFGDFALGLLDVKLRFVIPDKSQQNKSRWKTWQPWQRFLGDVRKLKIKINRETNALIDTHRWIEEMGVASAVKLFKLLEEHQALGEMEELSQLIEKAKIGDQLMSKATTHLSKINRLDLLPIIERETKQGAMKGA